MRRARAPANVRALAIARRDTISHTEAVVEALRAQAIERLLPPLVHRLNNAVAVFQGAFELGSRASPRDHENARRELAVLSASLERLSLLARAPSTRPQVVELDRIGQSCTLLLQPLAKSWKVEFEVHVQAGLATRCDAGLESLVLLTCYEFLVALQAQPVERRLLRLTLAASAQEGRLMLAALGPVGLPDGATSLRAYGEAHGLVGAQHATARGTAVRLVLPILFEHVLAPARPRAARKRVLLLQEPGQDRELAATLLREQGCEVREAGAVPRVGLYELVLLDEGLLTVHPGVLECLETQVRYGQLVRIRPPLRPIELLELLASGEPREPVQG